MFDTFQQTTIPPEIIYEILSYQFRDFMSNDHPSSSEKYNENLRLFLRSNLTVNKTFYKICTVLTYRYCNFTTAKRFHSLLQTLRERPELRNIVEVADFEELTSIGLGRTGEMNQMIKNLTNETLLEFLKLTKGKLREFLACEHIQDDIDHNVIYFLLRPGTVLSVLDFCGCSGAKFTESFIRALEKLYHIESGTHRPVPITMNYQITCLGLNDCTDLPANVVANTLRFLPELQKLDLSHTSIADETLLGMPHFKNLTHFSLAMCLKLTPQTVLRFFANHPSVTDENNISTLEWLNLKVAPHSSSWNEVHTMFLLKKLCQFGHNKTLQYLNIGGLPLNLTTELHLTAWTHYVQCSDTLEFIKWNFPKLKSLSIRDNNVPIDKLYDFLRPTTETVTATGFNEIHCEQKLKYLNISNNSYVNEWTIQDPALYTASPSLIAVEVSFTAWQQVEQANEKHELIVYRYKNPDSVFKDINDSERIKWRCYLDSSYGRRYWLYKTDPHLNRDDLELRSNITRFDTSGNRIIDICRQPDFLKFAQAKIMLGCGFIPQSRYRRNKCYRDLKPLASQYFTGSGRIAMPRSAEPIIAPRLPPGGWRIISHDDLLDTLSEVSATPEDETSETDSTSLQRRLTIQDGLYWDRSIHDLQALSLEATMHSNRLLQPDASTINEQEEYSSLPELQRRRSQLNLPGTVTNESLHQNDITQKDLKDHYVYDRPETEITKRYRLHFESVEEYSVFGAIERGMYRYYSLKT